MNFKPSNRHKRSGLAAASVTALLAVAAPAQAELIVGLTTTNALLTFDSATPMNGSSLSTISGLSLNERILSIDLRPTTGVLYGISTEDRVYTLTTAGVATLVGTLSTPLASDVVGLDFNPAADLTGATSLRIVSSTGQNFAFNVTTGATVVATPVQASFSSVAYSNNDTNPATATALYFIDTAADELKVAPTNFNGAPPPVPITTVGSLGFNANGVNGFDISGATGAAYAAMTDLDTGKSGLYTINLGTGAATFAGTFGIGGNTAIAPPLLGLTVAAIPEPGTYALMLAGLAAIGFVARRRSQG